MRILFAVQGTGNGHLSRASQLYPVLSRYGRVDVLVSGKSHSLKPSFPVRYQFDGLGFAFGRNGGIDFYKTYSDARIWKFLKSVEEVPVRNYDLVINDFEPVTAWACRLRDVPAIALSHQSALLKPGVPKPQTSDLAGELVLRHYAPANEAVGFHFAAYHPDIFTPVIRSELYSIKPRQGRHYTVYLPAYSIEKLIGILPVIRGRHWQVFARVQAAFRPRPDMLVVPVDAQDFMQSLASSVGVLCGAGFETPAEALHLGIPLMVVPMRAQYEQACNAAALEQLGVKVIWKPTGLNSSAILGWIEENHSLSMHYPDVAEASIERALWLFHQKPEQPATWSLSGLRSLLAG
ncbi:MAG: glycosyl transferase [Bacteroidetes bacterium]|nr:glycosyl transferase [Bacteroidota bacterium]